MLERPRQIHGRIPHMLTIARNHTNRIQAVRDAAKFCERYDKDTGNWVPDKVDGAIDEWLNSRRGSFWVDQADAKWTVHITSNRMFHLTVEDPKVLKARRRAELDQMAQERKDREAREQAAREEAARAEEQTTADGGGCWCGAVPCPMPAQHANVQAACDAMNANQEQAADAARVAQIASVPGFDRSTRQAMKDITDRHRAAAMTSPDLLGPNRRMIAQTGKSLRLQGLSHDDIRARYTAQLKAAQSAGDLAGQAAAESFLAVHAGMLADMASLARHGRAAQLPPAAPAQLDAPAPVAPVDDEHQEHEQEQEQGAAGPVPAPKPADDLPPHEEDYEPEPGAKSYPVRKVRAALEAAGIKVRDAAEDFTVLVVERDERSARVIIHHFHGDGAKPRKGPARDRWERRRAEILIALVDAGMADLELLNVGLWVRVPRPKGAATVVALGESDYGPNFEGEFIEQAVSLPQYPQITGWVLRRKWGPNYRGPLTPWMYHRGTGETVGSTSQNAQQAAEALAMHYGLLTPVRTRQA